MIVTQASFTPGWECQSKASNKVSRKVRVFNKTILGGQGFQQDHFGRSGFSIRPLGRSGFSVRSLRSTGLQAKSA